MNSIMNTAVGAMAVATFLVVCLMKKKKLKLSTVFTSLKGPYFYPTKQLTVKDEVFLSMLENCQSVGPCYVITDPSLRGRRTINNTHDIVYLTYTALLSKFLLSSSTHQIIRLSTQVKASVNSQGTQKKKLKDVTVDFFKGRTRILRMSVG